MQNFVQVVGNVTREPELSYTQGGQAVLKFGLAVNRSYNNRNGDKVEETDFFDVTAWRALAENVAESVTVGTRLVVSGRLKQDRWQNEEGEKRSKVFLLADEISVSLRWATASVTKTTRSDPGEWGEEPAPDPTPEELEAAAPAAGRKRTAAAKV